MSREPAVETDQRLRVGRRGYPLLPGGFGRSTLYMGAPSPLAVRGEGHRIWDDQGRELIDASNNFTTLIHGHAHPHITSAIVRTSLYTGTMTESFTRAVGKGPNTAALYRFGIGGEGFYLRCAAAA